MNIEQIKMWAFDEAKDLALRDRVQWLDKNNKKRDPEITDLISLARKIESYILEK